MATAMFYMVNGYHLYAEAGAVVALSVDVADGQLGAPDIAAILKDWAQRFDTTDVWIEDDTG